MTHQPCGEPASRAPGHDDLLGVFGEATDRVTALRVRLVEAAQDDGILDVAYRTLDTPVGVLLLAATERGLVRVAYACEGLDAVLQQMADRISPRILNAPVRLDSAAFELEEYFGGTRRVFELPLDWQLTSGFRRSVLHQLTEIDYGRTASYGAVAQLAGSPRAARAVGTACATNPLPVVVPCHRVLPASGGLGGYLGGPDAKQTLLSLEAAAS